MKTKRYDLITIIKNDFLLYGKTHLILLIAIILSASLVVITVYKTRLLITQEEKLILKKKEKNDEWRNLIIEKNSLSIHSTIQKK
ncbi:cell division protein FtsL [Buchnera aphidicola (Acyrthosiphon lactucae)]|uniref:Cell division protein FtsL n=1 Tax=Buchnera aphidicola (Acyrthosiphon lactucae) TaxID=1241832 RepID=A0A4D6XLU7_9GAMM|nr:cell division protein FtsL [Buchnera aphidicola]QCI17623.1 cell division protein FtsL [Buchnera aphidicola (Acyrthosiphon lactucae)]